MKMGKKDKKNNALGKKNKRRLKLTPEMGLK